ncbi:MAG: 2-oxo acid dehydrogenase subunit E2, partial [Planctomycetes bacterium]|nr:2-oxo acid dehydrogenase subunit E2 [Planctomycetota bacterium]
VTLTITADVTNLVNLRNQFKSLAQGQPSDSTIVPSYQDIVTKLVAEVLKKHPMLSSHWDNDSIVVPGISELNIGMAVDTDEGLVVPVIRNVAGLSLSQVSAESIRLIDRARSGRLTASDMQGGVFTITNLGSFGIEAFTPIINYPEAAILGLGAIRREPVVSGNHQLEDRASGSDVRNSDQIVIRDRMTLSLTFDHGLLDGATSAKFLQDLTNAIANPSAWLLII